MQCLNATLDSSQASRMQAYESEAERWAFLRPWTQRLRECRVRVKSAYAHDHTYRVRFSAIALNLPRAWIVDQGDALRMRATAEALELVSTALASCPQAWRVLVAEQCGCVDHFHPEAYEVEELAPRFEINCTVHSGATLMNSACRAFFEELVKGSTRSPAFVAALKQIQKLVGDASSPGHFHSVPIQVVLSTRPEVTHKLADFIRLVDALAAYKESAIVDSWAHIEAVSLEWIGLNVTPEIVERALALASYAPFFYFERITLDARKISCSASDLKRLLSTLGETYTSLEMDIGYDNANTMQDADDIQDACSRVRVLVDAVARMRGAVKNLNVGLLLSSIEHHELRREVFWHQIFGTLLHPSANCTIETLVFSSYDVLCVGADAKLIRQAASVFPGYKHPPSLVLEVSGACEGSLHAMVEAFGEGVRHLYLTDHEAPIPCSIVLSILRLCAQLSILDLDNVALDSMEPLKNLAHGSLSTLALSNVTLADRSSLEPFLMTLFDPQSSLGCRVTEFSLTRSGDPSEHWDKLVLSQHELSLVAEHLPRNRRLHSLRLDVNDDVPGSLIREAAREHHEPAAVRRSPLSVDCKLALLSATTHSSSPRPSARYLLSRDVLAVVFSFAAECMLRSVCIRKSFGDDGM